MKRMAILIACAALLPAAAASAQQQQQGTQPSRSRIEIDLRSTSATGMLPFDVPFEMVGDVPDRVDRISLVYRECGGTNCPKPGTITRDDNCSPVLDDRGEWQPPQALVWERDALTAPKPGDVARFSLPIDALEAQRRYVFLFDVNGTPTDDQTAAFHPRARELVSRRLSSFTDPDQSQAAYEALRGDLIAEVRTLAPCVVVGTLLDPTSNVDEEFTTSIADILDDQLQKTNGVTTFNQGATRLRANLASIFEAPLSVMVRKLRARPEEAADVDAHGDVIKLISLTQSQIEVVARGASVTAPDRNLQSMTADITADAATTRVSNLAQTRDLLRDLAAWLKRLDSDGVFDDLARTNDLTAEQVASLRALTVRGNPVDAGTSEAFRMMSAGRSVADNATSRDSRINALADQVRQEIRTVRLIGSDTVGTFDTFSSWYISADAGFAYAQEIESAVPYLGTNIYFRPINKDAPLRMKGGLKRRVSATLGLTVSSIADANKATRQDLFNTQSLIIGGGFRVTDALRVGGGALIYEKISGTNSVIAAAPYVSISFDWNVAKQFAGVGKLFQ